MPIAIYLRLISDNMELRLWNLLIPLMSDSPLVREGIQIIHRWKTARSLRSTLWRAVAWSLAGFTAGVLLSLVTF
jgi:hypothetical protein